ncbi:MAG: hypothetical protein J5645_01785 [Lachnospiraceae bacterium]|nr:hypothetical protein [Lachnospiraceae bacterium]
MKKSKWLWMLLVVLLALCLTACDDEDDDDESDKKSPTEAVQDVTPTETVATPTDAADVTPTGEVTIAPSEAPAKEFIWTIDESLVAADYLPAFTSEELTDCEGTSFTRRTIKVCEPRADVIAAMKNDTWVKSLGPLTDYYSEECNKRHDVSSWRLVYREGLLVAAPFEKGSDGLILHTPFDLRYEHDYANFTAENAAKVTFEEVDIKDPDVIANIERIVKAVYGEEIGNFLLRAKNSEENYNAEKPYEMRYDIVVGDMIYHFQRSFVSVDQPLSWAAFAFSVEPTLAGYEYVYYDEGYDYKVTDFGCLPNEVLAGDIGGDNILDLDTFADKLLTDRDKEIDAGLQYFTVSRYLCEDGRTHHSMSYELDEFKLEYTVGTAGGNTDYASTVELKLRTQAFPKADEAGNISAELIAETNRRFEVLFGFNPEITLDQLKQINGTNEYWNGSLTFKYTVLGKEKSDSFRIQFDGKTKSENYGHIAT